LITQKHMKVNCFVLWREEQGARKTQWRKTTQAGGVGNGVKDKTLDWE
jgi:hypothetical protein